MLSILRDHAKTIRNLVRKIPRDLTRELIFFELKIIAWTTIFLNIVNIFVMPELVASGAFQAGTSTAPAPVPSCLDRLMKIDVSKALTGTLPTRYDPYYRFPGGRTVYAPWDSTVLDTMERHGVTTYSLELAEDSKFWRLRALLENPVQMQRYVNGEVETWHIKMGLKGEEVWYDVRDIIIAHLAEQSGAPPCLPVVKGKGKGKGKDKGKGKGKENAANNDPRQISRPSTPACFRPRDLTRPSTPGCIRTREYIRATINEAGKYDKAAEEDEERFYSRPRSVAGEAILSSKPSTESLVNSSRSMSLNSGLDKKLKDGPPPVVWKTAYEFSQADLGRMLDEQAAQDEMASSTAIAPGKSEGCALVVESDSDDDEGPMPGSSMFRACGAGDSDSDDEDEDDVEKVDQSTTATTSRLSSMFRSAGDDDDDSDEEQEVAVQQEQGDQEGEEEGDQEQESDYREGLTPRIRAMIQPRQAGEDDTDSEEESSDEEEEANVNGANADDAEEDSEEGDFDDLFVAEDDEENIEAYDGDDYEEEYAGDDEGDVDVESVFEEAVPEVIVPAPVVAPRMNAQNFLSLFR